MVPCSNIGTRKWVAKRFQMVSVVAIHISVQGNKHGLTKDFLWQKLQMKVSRDVLAFYFLTIKVI